MGLRNMVFLLFTKLFLVFKTRHASNAQSPTDKHYQWGSVGIAVECCGLYAVYAQSKYDFRCLDFICKVCILLNTVFVLILAQPNFIGNK